MYPCLFYRENGLLSAFLTNKAAWLNVFFTCIFLPGDVSYGYLLKYPGQVGPAEIKNLGE